MNLSVCPKHLCTQLDTPNCHACSLEAKLAAAEVAKADMAIELLNNKGQAQRIKRLQGALTTTSEHNARLQAKVLELAQLLAPSGQGEAVSVIDDIVAENVRLRAALGKPKP